ncbi:MAG: hypothetical protein FJ272_22195 [Planctomycetes bacterium]|nr:hypothetical protein [Planctomycetota bacterium]
MIDVISAFDVEDPINEDSDDALLHLCRIHSDEGVRACLFVASLGHAQVASLELSPGGAAVRASLACRREPGSVSNAMKQEQANWIRDSLAANS